MWHPVSRPTVHELTVMGDNATKKNLLTGSVYVNQLRALEFLSCSIFKMSMAIFG